jgi:hypothetical protein
MPKTSGKTQQASQPKVASAKSEGKVVSKGKGKRPKKSAKVVGKAKFVPTNQIKKIY